MRPSTPLFLTLLTVAASPVLADEAGSGEASDDIVNVGSIAFGAVLLAFIGGGMIMGLRRASA